MLNIEWNWDDAKIAWQDEARDEEREEIARNALSEGLSTNTIHKITGLDMDTINKLADRC